MAVAWLFRLIVDTLRATVNGKGSKYWETYQQLKDFSKFKNGYVGGVADKIDDDASDGPWELQQRRARPNAQ